MRKQIVEDIAKSHSPNHQRELILAETMLEQRMKQPAYFSYPTPTRDTPPNFPQVGLLMFILKKETHHQPQFPIFKILSL